MEYDKNIGKWIIDTDPGSDDSLAILFGLKFIKDNLVALSVVEGNNSVHQCFLNSKKICAISNRFVPIYKGCELNMSNKFFNFSDFTEFHGIDGMFDVEEFFGFEDKYKIDSLQANFNEDHPFLDEYSPLKIIELCYKYNNLNILTIGKATNLSLAFMLDPNIVNRINKVVMMGGSYHFRGNVSAGSEFNFCADPIASKIILDNFTNVIIFPWETCERHKLTHSKFVNSEENDVNNFCMEILRKKLGSIEEGIFADYGAALAAFYPNIIKLSDYEYADVVIDSSSDLNGALIISKSNVNFIDKPKFEIIKEIDQNLFDEFFKMIIKR